MRLLVVCPDYASHAIPMLQVAIAWRETGNDVVVATGEAVRPLVEAAGLEWTHLRLGKGSNASVIRAEEQPLGEDDHLRAFFEATRAGAIATLLYQADARRHDLLHEPDRVLDELIRIVADVAPDRVLVDHVAFGARLALHAIGVDAATLVLGHPSALPAPGELYGLPPAWPLSIRPSPAELAELAQRCRESTAELAAAANELIARRSPDQPFIDDLTSLAGFPTIYVYPEELHDPQRPLPAGSVSIGALARAEELGDTRLPVGTGPCVLVAFGSFLSAREDVLATAVAAARAGGWRLALAHGSTPVERLGDVPDGSLIGAHLPQVALLAHADVMISHGGNNSIGEACAAGVPMIVLPFSTDQFAGAAAVERAGIGVALDPNSLTADALVEAVEAVLRSGAPAAARRLAASIAASGGPRRAVAAIRGDGCPSAGLS